MMTLEQKINKALEKEFNLNGYEIRNILSVAKRRNGGRLCEIASWYTAGVDRVTGFKAVECEICDAVTGRRLDDVVIECCMFDRRKSFIRKTIDEIM